VCNETAFLLSPVKPSFATRNNVKPKAKSIKRGLLSAAVKTWVFIKKVNTPVFTFWVVTLSSSGLLPIFVSNFSNVISQIWKKEKADKYPKGI